MKRLLYVCTIFFLWFSSSFSQETDTLSNSRFYHNIQASVYFIKKQYIFSPIYKIDKDALHLEFRYNYEYENTFTGWGGYNFSGGKKLEYKITPMAGVILGKSKGILPGLELEFMFDDFALSSEMEYVVDLENKENNYFYSWTDFTYAPSDWFWTGLSIQRTRLFHDDLIIQRGLLFGTGYKGFSLTGYLYNLGTRFNYYILSLTYAFPQD